MVESRRPRNRAADRGGRGERALRLAYRQRDLYETELAPVLGAWPKDFEGHVAADVRGDRDRRVERPPGRAKDACAHESVRDLPSGGVLDTPVDVRLEGSRGPGDGHGSSGRRYSPGRVDGDAVARRLWNAADVDDDARWVGENDRPPWPLVVESEAVGLSA